MGSLVVIFVNQSMASNLTKYAQANNDDHFLLRYSGKT
jgi:hypothetical protein